MRILAVAVTVLLLVGAGCNKTAKLQTKEAVQAAIESHLKQRPNVMMANMNLEVDEVKFAGDTAEAETKFRSKQSPDLAVGVHYKLRLAGDHWQVESGTPSGGMGGSPHGSGAMSTPAPSAAESPLKANH
jgi:hypothetical protein